MKMRPNHLLFVGIIAMLAVAIPSPSLTQTAKSQLPKEITFATAREGTVYYTMTVGMANIINKYTPMKANVQPIGFIRQWGPSMQKGDVQLSMQGLMGSYAYHYGALYWKDQPSHKWLQQLTSGHGGKYGFFVRADSNIRKIPDLVGKKFYVLLPAVPLLWYAADGIFEYYGIRHEDVHELTVTSWAEAVQEVIDGRADAVITSLGAGFPRIQRAGGCRVLPITKEAGDYLHKKYPFYSRVIVPAGYMGLPKDTSLVVDPVILLTHRDVPADVTYTVLKALYDHHAEFSAVHAEAKEWSLHNATKAHLIPYHSGAMRYLKEKGLWTNELDQFQKEALAKELKK
jgi:TRAP transporter TAXI family solute receptor